MGKRGPARTPTPILKLTGSREIEKRSDTDIPEAMMVAPDAPSFLKPREREAWDTLVTQLDRFGVLCIIDGNSLARYCGLWAKWTTLDLDDDDDVRMAIKIAPQLTRLEQEFGMTPSSRSNLDIKIRALEEDALTAIQNRKKDRVTG